MTTTTISPTYHTKEYLAERANESLDRAERYIDKGWVIVKAHSPIFSTSGRVGCTCEHYKRSDNYRQWLADNNREIEYNPAFICPNPGKHPHGNWKDIAEPMSYKKAVAIWGSPQNATDVDTGRPVKVVWNIGVLTGPSDLLTLDADTYKEHYQCDLSELIPMDDQETPQQFTHSGGLHLVFCREGKPYSNSNGELKFAGIDGVDIRGEGGFQVIEPSLGPSGNKYAWIEGYEPWTVAPHPIPAELDRLLAMSVGKSGNPAQLAKFTTPTTVEPDLAQWDLSHKILDLLHDPPSVGKRSEADQKVITALVYAGATNDAILAFFEHFPLGTQGRFAERGRDYLARSIGKARLYVENHPHQAIGNSGGVDDMAADNGFGPTPSVNLSGAVHTNGHSSATAQQTTTQTPGAAPAGGKVPPIVALLKAINDAGDDAKSKMVAGKMPAPVRAALDSKIQGLSTEIAANAAHAVLIADAIQRAGGYVFDDALLFVQECILSAQMGKERAKGFAAIKVKVDKLRNMGHKFRLNLLEDTVEMNNKIVDDVGKSELSLYMSAHGIRKNETDDVLNVLAKEDAYHPIKDYLNGLVWDGKNHFGEMTRHLTGDGRYIDYKYKDKDGKIVGRLVKLGDTRDDANGIVTATDIAETDRYSPLHHVIIYRWMLGCASRAMEGDKQMAFKFQTPVLVFVGGQGLGKSAWVRHLVSGVGFDYHRESPLDPHHPEHVRSAVSKWIWEISELGSSLRKADREALKGFITQEWHTYRKPYGRGQITKPTLCNFVGTINNETGFLDDPTGNRRYLPLHITAIDHSYKDNVDINQVWAQIMHLYKSGQSPMLSAIESAAMGETLEEHEVENPLQGHIQRLFIVNPARTGDFTFTSDIIHALKQDGIALNANSKWAGREVNEALIPLGVSRDKRSVSNVKGWGWIGVRER